MSDKIERLIEDFHRLSKSICEAGQSPDDLERKYCRMISKMVKLEDMF